MLQERGLLRPEPARGPELEEPGLVLGAPVVEAQPQAPRVAVVAVARRPARLEVVEQVEARPSVEVAEAPWFGAEVPSVGVAQPWVEVAAEVAPLELAEAVAAERLGLRPRLDWTTRAEEQVEHLAAREPTIAEQGAEEAELLRQASRPVPSRGLWVGEVVKACEHWEGEPPCDRCRLRRWLQELAPLGSRHACAEQRRRWR